MDMRKFALFIITLVLMPCLLFASQKLFDYNSPEYIQVADLALASGVIGPSSATPITEDELLTALKRVDPSKLSFAERESYNTLIKELEPNQDFFQADYTIDITPQLFLSTKQGTLSRKDFFLPYREEKPGINIGTAMEFGNYIFVEGYIPLMNSALNDEILRTSFGWLLNYKDGNLNFFGTNNSGQFAEIPVKARGAVGNKWANIILGRSKHSMGTGYTGNMMIGDNFLYQEILKTTLTSNYFTYNISMTHFDSQDGLTSFETTGFNSKHQTRVVHRFDVNILNKVRAVVNLGTLYYADTPMDIRWFTPFMIAHNYYNYDESYYLDKNPRDEANNIFSFELEAAIIPRLSISAQFTVDQFQTFFEDKGALPMAYGGLINLTYLIPVTDGSIKLWTEGALTSEYLYLNEKYEKERQGETETTRAPVTGYQYNYNYDHILGYHRRGWQNAEISYTGYQYGPDSIVYALGLNYTNNKLGITSNTALTYVNTGRDGILNPTFEKIENKIRRHTIRIENHTNWDINTHFSAFGGVGLTWYFNSQNSDFLPQFYLGFTWKAL